MDWWQRLAPIVDEAAARAKLRLEEAMPTLEDAIPALESIDD
jgi:hypothetical protein